MAKAFRSGNNKEIPFYLFSIAVFLIIISPNLFSKGMFMDGLIYATISKNMANGLGSFWHPYNAAIFLPYFNGHPPLAFGLQSVFFRLLGEGLWVEKLYSFLTFCITGILLQRIWKYFFKDNGWLPLFFWFMIPSVQWACSNNILENTLEIWTTLSIYLFLRGIKKGQMPLHLLLSSGALFLGLLSKGPVALFPCCFPFFYYTCTQSDKWLKGLLQSLLLSLGTATFMLLLLVTSPNAAAYLLQYSKEQVINSLQYVTTVSSRWYIMGALLSDLILPVSLALVFCVITALKLNQKKILRNTDRGPALLFLFTGLSGILPIMISRKQSSMYILPALPFFALFLAVSARPYVSLLLHSTSVEYKAFRRFKQFSYICLVTGLTLLFAFSFTYNREKDKIRDIQNALKLIPTGSIINVYPGLNDDYDLHEYFSRLKEVSTDEDLRNRRHFLFIEKRYLNDSMVQGYIPIPLHNTTYSLFENADERKTDQHNN